MAGEEEHPFFGKADAIYNVIDSRQNDPQNRRVLAVAEDAGGVPLTLRDRLDPATEYLGEERTGIQRESNNA